jgi:hypothetical protein
MTENVKLVPRCNDEQVIALFNRLSAELGLSAFDFYIYGSDVQVETASRQDLLNKLQEQKGYLIRRAVANRQSDQPNYNHQAFSIEFERGQRLQNGNYQPSLHTDSIKFNQGHLIKAETAYSINSIIESEMFSSATPKLTAIDENTLEELSRNHQQFLDGMRRNLLAVSEELTHFRIESERELRERKAELDRTAEHEAAKLHAAHNERLAAIEAKRAKLAEREKQLDDRNNTHARRDLQNNIKEHLSAYKTKFELTEGTRNLRKPVLWTVMAIESTLILLLLFVFLSPPQGGDFWDKSFFWIKSFGLTFLAAGTAVWFLRWLTHWSARHADAEFQLRQLELDIARASWVVETTLEWKASQDTSIPDPLLDAISRNLFVAGEARNESADSPADHLASALLGDASKVKLKSGDHEIEYDRAAIKRTKRPHERE